MSSSVQFESGKTRIALARVLARVVEPPQLRALVLRVPAVLGERNEKMRSLARDFSSSRRAPPKAASKPYWSSACFRPSVFHMSVCSAEPWSNGLMPAPRPSGFWWTSSSMPSSRPSARATRTCAGTSRSCRRAAAGTAAAPGRRPSRARCSMHRAVLADRVQHHRLLALGDHLAHDVDALGLEPLQVRRARPAVRSCPAGPARTVRPGQIDHPSSSTLPPRELHGFASSPSVLAAGRRGSPLTMWLDICKRCAMPIPARDSRRALPTLPPCPSPRTERILTVPASKIELLEQVRAIAKEPASW